jgi:hypothetical protein
MTFVQKLNAIMRFSLYFSLLLFIVKRNILVWYFAVFIAFVTIFMNEFYVKNQKLQKELYQKINVIYDDKKDKFCALPSKENPFMNVLMNEYTEFPNRPGACDLSNRKVKDKAEDYFNEGLYKSVDDIWSRKTNSRNWHTVPVTTIPNDRDSFTNWLYGSNKKSCKEGNNNQCYSNIYHSYKI